MGHYSPGADRAIIDYFNSLAFHAPSESELLATILTELMPGGKPATLKTLIASVIAKLERESDEATLHGYRSLLTRLLAEKKPGPHAARD